MPSNLVRHSYIFATLLRYVCTGSCLELTGVQTLARHGQATCEQNRFAHRPTRCMRFQLDLGDLGETSR
jgi:hypothetical protein